MAGRQAQCLTVLVLILGFFTPNVKADAGMMCPLQSIIDFLPKTPKTTCPVIKLSGVHWSHSKTTRKTYIHGNYIISSINIWIYILEWNNLTMIMFVSVISRSIISFSVSWKTISRSVLGFRIYFLSWDFSCFGMYFCLYAPLFMDLVLIRKILAL